MNSAGGGGGFTKGYRVWMASKGSEPWSIGWILFIMKTWESGQWSNLRFLAQGSAPLTGDTFQRSWTVCVLHVGSDQRADATNCQYLLITLLVRGNFAQNLLERFWNCFKRVPCWMCQMWRVLSQAFYQFPLFDFEMVYFRIVPVFRFVSPNMGR